MNENGFEVIEHRKSSIGVEVIFQLINAYIYKITVTRYSFLNLLCCVLLMSPVNIIGLVLSKFLPRNSDLYLNNIVLAKKISNL